LIADRWLKKSVTPAPHVDNSAVEGDQKRAIRDKSENRETILDAMNVQLCSRA
jgi:hypothetical protein